MKRTLSVLAMTVLLTVVGTGAAWAQGTYMSIPGIQGGSTHIGHEGWIEVLSLSQGWSEGPKRSTACDVFAMKALDISGPRLWAAGIAGQVFTEIKIEVVRGGETAAKLYEIRLANARLTSVQLSGSGADFTESVGLTAESATILYYPQLPNGTVGPPVTTPITCR